MSFKKTFLPALILAVICLVSALALALTNELTRDRIAKVENERYLASVKKVLPEGALPEPLALEGIEGFVGKDADGNVVGYAVKTAAKGYGGDVTCVVGFDTDGKIIELSVSAPDETPGVGSKVTAFSKPEDVQVISGATYSSGAVVEAVAKAQAQFQLIPKGGE